jgi:tetrapyrrole methylase family protein/MazG family protein
MNKNDISLSNLVAIVDRLRGEGGCPWDREQTVESLKTFIIEESYEVLQAITEGSHANLKEELGDLLLQIVLISRIASENGWFSTADVIASISDKIVRRHPHVFGDYKASSSSEVISRWEKYKKDEGRNLLDGVPLSLPALLQALRVSEKVSRVGFDFEKIEDVLAKLDEELSEFKEAVRTKKPGEIESEIGDMLFTIANIARFLKINPEESLRKMVRRFIDRFTSIEKELKKSGMSFEAAGIKKMDELWEKAKKIS